MNLLNSLKSNTGTRSKKTYTLDEVCVIMKLKHEQYNNKQIAEVLGHPELSIGYKVRWLGSFDKIEDIFSNFNVKMVSEDDVMTRADAFLDKLAVATQEEVA